MKRNSEKWPSNNYNIESRKSCVFRSWKNYMHLTLYESFSWIPKHMSHLLQWKKFPPTLLYKINNKITVCYNNCTLIIKVSTTYSVSMHMSKYWERGKFGDYERGVRVAQGAAECNSSLLIQTSLQTSQVLNISTYAQLSHELMVL